MSYIFRLNSDNPLGAWPLDSITPPFVNTAGSSLAASVWGSGPSDIHPSLVAGNGNALIETSSGGLRFSSPVFENNASFSVEIWFKPIKVTGPVRLLSHSGVFDGLTFDGDKISFSTSYTNTGTSSADYYTSDYSRSYYVVGVHTTNKNSLYVDGVLVSESDVNSDQQADSLLAHTNAGFLYSGSTQNTGDSIAIDAPAIYGVALTPGTINRHFSYGINAVPQASIVNANGGILWQFSDQSRSILLTTIWDRDSTWRISSSTDILFLNDSIAPAFDTNGLTLAGQWIGFINYDITSAGIIPGARIEWDGDGQFTVETSIDGTTWHACTNGMLIPNSINWTPGGNDIDIRITFAAGQTSAVIRSLKIVIYSDFSVDGSRVERPLEIHGNAYTSTSPSAPLEHDDFGGLTLAGGFVVVNPDTTSASKYNVKTVEMWATFKSLAAGCLMDYRTSANASDPWVSWSGTAFSSSGVASVFVNGQPMTLTSFAPIVGRTYHLVFILSSTGNVAFVVGSNFDHTASLNINLTSLAVYNSQLSAATVLSAFNSNLGIVSMSFTDNSQVKVTETSNSYSTYAFDWSLTGSIT